MRLRLNGADRERGKELRNEIKKGVGPMMLLGHDFM